MTVSTQKLRQHLQEFDFRRLFIEELGWNSYTVRLLPFDLDGIRYSFSPIAEQGSMAIVMCQASDGNIPPTGARRKVDRHITELAFEHIIIFVDRDKTTSLWQWTKREDGKAKSRTHTYRRGQLADALLQKLAGIAFDISELDEEGKVSIAAVTERVKKAFDVESLTKKFYEQFKTEHSAFLKFLADVQDTAGREWYASVMLNRLMFLYFIQKKRFLNGDPKYLQTKLDEIEAQDRNYFQHFLLTLFFDGLACEERERTEETNRLMGTIPYLNGGLFLPHEIEEQYSNDMPGDQIEIPNDAFARLFNFFNAWDWNLDVREHRAGNEINPDVLGYIFEKYINQKEMGAYYTKEDITGYICKNTILPFLLDKVGVDVSTALREVEPYVYDAVSTTDYLPTETEREYIARRRRYEQIRADFADGKIAAVNDLVTYNLDIIAFAEDWLRGLNDPVALRRFYFECLTKLTVLDPTCGSGAFLFAAMNILESLYELALDKMRQFADSVKHLDFRDELERVSKHPNRRYFVFKSIIVNNLYGVDLMEEAVEICKLRLFLKLVAQIDDVGQIEPLPDIDFNIRAGNTLVGFATQSEIEGRLFATDELKRKVAEADRSLRHFRQLQTRLNVGTQMFRNAKAEIESQLDAIRVDLDRSLMDDYGQSDLATFRRSHQPFHWYVEFNHVMANGGFDVIVGNPPYVEYSKVKKEYQILGYTTEKAGNLYAMCTERFLTLSRSNGRFGEIVPLSGFSSARMEEYQRLFIDKLSAVYISYFSGDAHPSVLFDGVKYRLCVIVGKVSTNAKPVEIFVSDYYRFYADERDGLFDRIRYEKSTFSEGYLRFAKAGNPDAQRLIAKLLANKKTTRAYLTKKSGHILHYHRSPNFWIRAMDFEPYFKSPTRTKSEDHVRDLFISKPGCVKVIGAVLSSSLFYFWFITQGNCRNLTGENIEDFPVGDISDDIGRELSIAYDLLMADVRKNSKRRVIEYKLSGRVEYDEYYLRPSKGLIDNIDLVLARHYGFTDEELDFIINYDIKYRMGKDADEREEE